MEQDSAIGIFDSGIGGLTVAHAITQLLPSENLIYFGDTAHFPYGDKSAGLIQKYSAEITEYLLSRRCKMIVIACNTASAHAFKTVQKAAGSKAFVVNVVDPAAEAIARRFGSGKIGIIGTRGTINSGIYPRKIKKLNPALEVTSLATPLLAPMIEEGFFNNKISKAVIHSYLDKKSFRDIKALILACTHYPLIRKEIEDFYKGAVEVFDSAEMVAVCVKQLLDKQGLLNTHRPRFREFYVSDLTDSFEKSASNFFPGDVTLKKLVL